VKIRTGKKDVIIEVVEMGTIILKPKQHGMKKITITEVLFSTEVHMKVIAIQPMMMNGCQMELNFERMNIYIGENLVMSAKVGDNGLYTLWSHMAERNGLVMSLHQLPKADALRLIHNQLGHLHTRVILDMIKQGDGNWTAR